MKPLTATRDARVSFALPPPVMTGGKPIALVGAGAGIAGLGLLLVVIGMMRKAPVQPSMQSATTGDARPPGDPNATKFSGQMPVASVLPLELLLDGQP